MQFGKVIFVVLLVLYAGACAADSIKVGENTYENVYVSESSSKYFVCFPADGTLITVPKQDVLRENLNVAPDRETRKSLYDKWVAKRNELKGYSDVSAESTSQSNAENSATSSEDASPENSKIGRKVLRISGQSVQNYDLSQRQADIEAKRRQKAADKYRMLTDRTVVTSEDARSGNGVQWNNTTQWNNSSGGGVGGGQLGSGGNY